MEKSDSLQKELEKLEIDTSVEARQSACNGLSSSVTALQKRMLQTN